MNEKKICFIACVNDEEQFSDILTHIQTLNVPEGIELDLIEIRDAQSMAAGYNEGMKASDAKYKVYLHQDVYILNKDFVANMIQSFTQNPNVGLMGVAGAKKLPANGIWWESPELYGKVYDSHKGKMELNKFGEVQENVEIVEAIDGLIIMTQYDLPWREDIFDGWHFYDLSQSIEFRLQGYDVAVPKQQSPWVLHDCGFGINTSYDSYRKIFLEEYAKEIFPKVSVLIPTYNRPQLFEQALQSVLNQTYKNIEIIIGDDSTNNETEKLMQSYIELPYIHYYRNPENLGQFENDIKLFDLATGEYINYLMDDDLFHPQKIEKMMNYFLQDSNTEITLVTSYRKLIDKNGNTLPDLETTKRLFEQDQIMNGIDFGNAMLTIPTNLIGEPSTVLFRKKDLYEPFGSFSGRNYGCNVDMASWVNLLSIGKIVYIAEPLSYFRIHDEQQQQSNRMLILGAVDFAHQILYSHSKGFFKDFQQYKKSIQNLLKYIHNIENLLNEKDKNTLEFQQFTEYTQKLQQKYESLKIHERNNLPLVSVLIRTYNLPHYFEIALKSVLNQTYKNIEIIVGDDSTNDEVENLIQPYLKEYKNITYFKNERGAPDYGYTNLVNCFKRSKGEYINFLNQDDFFHREKIERMMNYFMQNSNLTLATSVRQPIDELGNELPLNAGFSRVFDKDTILSGYELSRIVIHNLLNFIGEPSTILFKRKYLNENELNYFNGTRYKNIGDVANWFSLLQYGDAVYISEPLSFCRLHPNQNSNNHDVQLNGVIFWYQLIKDSFEKGIIQNQLEFKTIILKWLTTFIPVIKKFIHNNDLEIELMGKLSHSYKEAIDEVLKGKKEEKFECPICNNKVEKFLPYTYKKHKDDFTVKFQIIGSDTNHFTCPNCLCHDRTRHLAIYFNKLDIWNEYIKNKKVLHIAPEKHLQQIISKLNTKEYVCGDLYPADNMTEKVDITDTSFEDNYFDIIICNHVLEHIPEDLKAMKEMYRILKKGGKAVLQTPYSPVIEQSFEDETKTSEHQRKKYFGQVDHVRVYGLDFFERLKMMGFKLEIVQNDSVFSKEECKKYGVNPREDLILVTKN